MCSALLYIFSLNLFLPFDTQLKQPNPLPVATTELPVIRQPSSLFFFSFALLIVTNSSWFA